MITTELESTALAAGIRTRLRPTSIRRKIPDLQKPANLAMQPRTASLVWVAHASKIGAK